MCRKAKIFVMVAIWMLVFASMTNAAVWQVPKDFLTIQSAIDSPSVQDGDKIMVAKGYYAGAKVTKAVEIKGTGGAVINDGPSSVIGEKFGLYIPAAGSGATINNLQFELVELPVFGIAANDVTVTQCKMINSVQSISNNGGSSWEITQNEIQDLRFFSYSYGGETNYAGGIGIVVSDYYNTIADVSSNVISHNKITGTLTSPSPPPWSGGGILLVTYFTSPVTGNRAVQNKVSLVSAPGLTVHGITLQQTGVGIVENNAIGFNDLRGTVSQITLFPDSLDQTNYISRNLGENRGHGLSPKIFLP